MQNLWKTTRIIISNLLVSMEIPVMIEWINATICLLRSTPVTSNNKCSRQLALFLIYEATAVVDVPTVEVIKSMKQWPRNPVTAAVVLLSFRKLINNMK